MSNFINSVASVLQSGAQMFEKLGSATERVVEASLRGRYVQRDGETNEAYQARLEFLKDRDIRRQENRLKSKQLKAEERSERRELKNLRQKERQEAKIRKKLERNEPKVGD